MKKIITLWMGILFALGAQAQEVDLGKVHIGVFIGPNLSTHAVEGDELNASNRFGYQLGGLLRYGDRVYLQSGLTYFSMSSRLSYPIPIPVPSPGAPVEVADRVNVRYLQLPVLAGVRFYQQRRRDLGLRLQAGPAISMLMGVNDNELQLSSNDYRNLWLGAQAGLGMDVWFFTLDLGYQWGLSNAFSRENYDGRYRMTTLSLGITF